MIIAIYNNAYGDDISVTGDTIEQCLEQLESETGDNIVLDHVNFYDASPLRVTRSVTYTAEFC